MLIITPIDCRHPKEKKRKEKKISSERRSRL
jgi:hypothetical protein